MRIESLVIDGFKSYAVRTEIFFDSTFTAITGLNGSGKSNILDSICFVLGITNMTTLRAQNLQDLIYKRGQAGVTKASVTIVFANDDKKTSPVGFKSEDHPKISVTRQIVMGGTSKYLINGHRAQQQSVQNLFQSVQLNINNPNFLIMQGRITKVLNMKPGEVLAMIEEAAGTRMFEERKDKAIKSLAKKEAAVNEINTLLAEEIEPKLEKLRGEKRAFLEFQQVQSDLERLTKMVVAHDYTKLSSKLATAEQDLNTKVLAVNDLENSQARMKKEVENMEEDIREIQARREKELSKGGRFTKLSNQVKELSHEVVRLSTKVELKEQTLEEEKIALEKVNKSHADLVRQLELKKADFQIVEKQFLDKKSAFDLINAEYVEKDDLLQSLATGVSNKQGQESGYMNHLIAARNAESAAKTEEEQSKLKIKHLESRLQEEEPRAKKAKLQNQALLNNLDSLRKEAVSIETRLESLGHDEEIHQSMLSRRTTLSAEINNLQDKAEGYRRTLSNVEFTYSDPIPDFDRTQVKGLVAQLFTLDVKHFSSSTALEVCAGGRLYNVVVTDEKVGSALLTAGKLKKRVTIIPLNKISALRATAEKLGAAKALCPGKVDLALELVGYDEQVTKAMEFVFGNTLICKDAETAKRVTFDPSVRIKSVTLDGDIYDPSGTLSGGSKPSSNGLLINLQKMNEVTRSLEVCQKEFDEIESLLISKQKVLQEASKLKQALDLKTHEVKLTEAQINGNSDSKLIAELQEMRDAVLALKAAIETAKVNQAHAKSQAQAIEKDMDEFKDNKDGKLVAIQKDINRLKDVIESQSTTLKVDQKAFQTIQLELEQLGGDVGASNEAVTEAHDAVEAARSDLSTLRHNAAELKHKHDLAEAELANELSKLTGFDQELKSLEEASRSKNATIHSTSLEIQKLKHDIDKFKKDLETTEQSTKAMLKEHDWIDSAQGDFNKVGSIYDFTGQDMTKAKQNLKTLSERFAQMKKRVNAKVMNMIDGVEKKETSLVQMVRTIHRDKKKIEETISSLDEYKLEALDKTWRKVTVDFGNIFGELLPGNTAKLTPIEGKEITAGLEVKVCLGKVWKQSLTELSGGQRSLIALSLIMSLLQYKPAPMYILDEVDAALDLSHTQNIGALIKARFKGSQFIVVSLKEGMFTNANRIMRTRFMDNTSIVLGGDKSEK